VTGVTFSCYRQYRVFKQKQTKKPQPPKPKEQPKPSDGLNYRKNMAAAKKVPTYDSGSESHDSGNEKSRTELVQKNRVAMGFDASEKQKKELADLQKQISELESKFGNDMGGMMDQLKML
jgi:hypothetical protein